MAALLSWRLAFPPSVRDLSTGLPFSLDDTDAAARAFVAGRAGDATALADASLWAYGWATRYVARKFVNERIGEASDADAALTTVVSGLFGETGIFKDPERLADPARFPGYVMVACKNALRTHRARRRTFVEADDTVLAPTLDDDRFEGDARWLRRDVEAAIADLPPAVRTVVDMFFLNGASYEEVAAATGHPLPTVRTYVSKGLARLRLSPHLRAHFFDDVLPPGAAPPGPAG